MEDKIIRGQAWIHSEEMPNPNYDPTDRNSKKTVTKDSLIQDTIRVVAGVGCFSETEVLIDDIWDDLTSASSSNPYHYKSENVNSDKTKGYFYWEYSMNNVDDDDTVSKIRFDCPQPKDGIIFINQKTAEIEKKYINPTTGVTRDATGDYADVWVNKLLTARANSEKYSVIQRKVINLGASDRVSPESLGGATVIKHTDPQEIKNTDLNDITPLLGLF